MNRLLAILFVLGTLLAPLLAQRPRNVEEALSRLTQVEQQEERLRHRPVRDLGRFAEQAVTDALLRELARATTLSYRQTVVRALGDQPRSGVIAPLQQVLRSADNARLCDSAAAALAAQGDDGAIALADELPISAPKSAQRNAVCYALARLTHPAAQQALLKDLKAQQGRDRLPALRGLAAHDDEALRLVRRALAIDSDTLLAATALQQLAAHADAEASALGAALAKRLQSSDEADRFTAVLLALLVTPAAEHFEVLLVATAHADDPFAEARQADWLRTFAVDNFATWLAEKAVSRKDADERIAAARLLGLAPSAQHDIARGGLQKLLLQREVEVAEVAASGFGRLGGEASEQLLEQFVDKASSDACAAAIAALDPLRHDQPEWLDKLRQLAANKRVAVRSAALRTLAASRGAADAADLAASNLGQRDWQVRAAAIELLVRGRSATSPPLLFERLDQEKARLQQDLVDGLFDLTGLRFGSVAEWRSWWQKEGANFQPIARREASASDKDKGARSADAGTASYWNIPVTSDRVVFVVDVSGSMTQPFGTGDGTRLDEAKRQLRLVFDRLPSKCKLNVISFAAEASALFGALSALDKARRKQADSFVEVLTARGPTNVHAALRLAFADAEVDTVFLLTDGRPSTGAIVAPNALADEVQRWNLGRGVRIHTIAIGEPSDFLERLARDSGGEHSVAR